MSGVPSFYDGVVCFLQKGFSLLRIPLGYIREGNTLF